MAVALRVLRDGVDQTSRRKLDALEALRYEGPMRNIFISIVFGFVFASFAIAQEGPTRPYAYPFTARDRYLLAQARVHEASWGNTVSDGGGILQVMMNCRRPDETLEAVVARRMPHFYAGVMAARGVAIDPSEVTDRLWVLELPNAPITRSPEHWPYGYPARVHSDDWSDANEEIQRYIRGELPLPFSEHVVRWFGRTTDGEQLSAALEDGWCEAIPNGPPSVNAFLYDCGEIDPD